MDSKISNKFLMGAVLCVISIILVLLFTNVIFPDFFKKIDSKSLSWRFRSKFEKLNKRNYRSTIRDILIVDVDKKTLEKLGHLNTVPRKYFADVIDYLSEARVISIGIDFLFNKEDTSSVDNDLLVSAIYKAGNVCLALSFSNADPNAFLFKMTQPPEQFYAEKFTFKPDALMKKNFLQFERFDGEFTELYNNTQKVGFANFFPDESDMIRNMPLFINFADKIYPSFALAVVLQYFGVKYEQLDIRPGEQITIRGNDGNSLHIPIDNQGCVPINYVGDHQTFQYISFYDIYAKHIPADFLRNRIVLIGSSLPLFHDLRQTPFRQAFPGVELQANLIYNILEQNFIDANSEFYSLLVLICLMIVTSYISIYTRLRLNMPLVVILSISYVYTIFLCFEKYHIWLECVPPLSGIIVAWLVVSAYKYVDYLKNANQVKKLFGNNFSAESVARLIKRSYPLNLKGEQKEATAIYCQIKDFSAIMDEMTSFLLIKTLNEYLSEMTEVVLKYDGYIERNDGDTIVGIWGIPMEQDDHALHACSAAIEMLESLDKLNERWAKEKKITIATCFGIHTGPMIVGNIGIKNGFHYRALGSNVDLAIKLEAANHMYGTKIIISEDTFHLVHNKLWVRELDFIRVKNRAKPIRIYELLGKKSEKIDPQRSSSMEYFVQGLELYREHDWVSAYDMFHKALQLSTIDGPSKEFIRRCKIFMDHPRPEDWDGVFNLRSA